MKPLGQFDSDYADRVFAAAFKAVAQASLDKESNTAFVRNAEVADALTMIVASMLASSDVASTPRGMRTLGEEFGKKLTRHIKQFREELKNGGKMPFEYVDLKNFH